MSGDGAGIAPLPDGSRLVHIGPPKTGTTSLQAAFWEARADALAQGVRYAGSARHSARAVLAATGRRTMDRTRSIPSRRHWETLLAEIRGATERVVVLSSEAFSYARADSIPGILGDLGLDRVHVLVTLRPIPRLLASEWQEHVQSGLRLGYEAWLDATLRQPDSRQAGNFWHRQRHDALLARWAGPIGAERVTAIVVDEADPGHLFRSVEGLTGLRTGTLVAVDTLANRSLTLPEIRAIQALAERWEAEGLDMARFHELARMKVAAHLKTRRPPADEPRIETPQWALDRAGEIAAEVVAGIRASGVRVIGDLDSLSVVPRGLPGDRLPDVPVPPEVAAQLAMGFALAGGLRSGADRGPIEPMEIARVPTRELVRLLGSRARRILTRPFRGGR